MATAKLEIRLGRHVTLAGCECRCISTESLNGSKIDVLKPYLNVTIVNNKGTEIFWRLKRKDTISEVKAKLATVQPSTSELLEILHILSDC